MKTLTTVGGMASRFVTRLSAPTTSGTSGRDGGNGDDYAMESNAETNPLVLNREVLPFDEPFLSNTFVRSLFLSDFNYFPMKLGG